jgi:hypothetical protein
MDSQRVFDLVMNALTDILRVNGDTPFTHHMAPPCTLIFFSAQIPAITVRDYVFRLYRYSCVTEESFVVALILLERALVKYRTSCPAFLYCPANIHRYLAAALVVASKSLEDGCYTNKYYASMTGLPLSELNALEVAILKDADWKTHVSKEEYQHFLGRCALDSPPTSILGTNVTSSVILP